MYKNMADMPSSLGPAPLADILGISRNMAHELVNRAVFLKNYILIRCNSGLAVFHKVY